MKWRLGFLACAALLLAIFPASAQKQITSVATNYGSGTMKVAPLSKDLWVASLEQLGVREDEHGGPLRLLSTDLVMVMYQDRTGLHYHGYETQVDKDGDKILWEVWDAEGKGLGKTVTGTGKFAGIEGTMQFVLLDPPQPFPEGTIRAVCRETIKVTLKNPM